MGCLHDPANVQQTSSKCIQNTRANAGRLLYWKFAGCLLDRVNTPSMTESLSYPAVQACYSLLQQCKIFLKCVVCMDLA